MRKVSISAFMLFLFMIFPAWQAPAQGPSTDLGSSYVKIVDQVLPSVVNISSTRKVDIEGSPMFSDPFFRDFFGNGVPRERVQQALGSGVIISPDGIIVTNNHVVGDADQVKVSLSDGRTFTAKLIGQDPLSDIAVIRIDARGLPAIRIGDSSKLRTGMLVLAVGSSFGLEGTVTHGIVSSVGRTGLGITDYDNFIQTDAPINPGNSGGALVNMNGELIGISTAIATGGGGSVGVGFAIPVNQVMSIVRSIQKTGRVVRGWLGVTVEEVTQEMLKELGMKTAQGALVVEAAPGSPAARAGIRQGDVITSVSGREVKDASALKMLISQVRPGTTVPVGIVREGKAMRVNVTVGDLSKAQADEDKQVVKDNPFLAGASVSPISAALRQKLEIPQEISGVVVTGVMSNSPAAKTGLRPGDVIMEINGAKISGLSDFQQVVREFKGRKISMSIYREGLVLNINLSR
ncbi:MAG TPA: Do family serine endopeptidase [Deltaproteobacteria bacterium]|nr:Do family serine endopeptidase [Deltaproteobacteria bacterium]HOI06099.1 Do family serine endopeptidase [Deltaproteobacteria bacterium]